MRIENSFSVLPGEVYGGGCATVCKGIYRGQVVAIKTLQLYLTSDYGEHFGVSTNFSDTVGA